MATPVITVFTLTGPQDRLRQIARKRAYRTCAPEHMTWEDETTLVMTLESGIGTSFLGHGLGLSDEYPDVSIRGMEYFDCFDDPAFAKWQGGELVYEADLITVFGILFPTDATKDWPGCSASFWHRSPPLATAIAENCPHFDLMPLRQLAGPVPRWVETTDAFATLFLRLPSTPDAQDGVGVIFYPEIGRSTLLTGIDRFGGVARFRRQSYGQISAQCPELRDVLRGWWKASEKKRRKARQERKRTRIAQFTSVFVILFRREQDDMPAIKVSVRGLHNLRVCSLSYSGENKMICLLSKADEETRWAAIGLLKSRCGQCRHSRGANRS